MPSLPAMPRFALPSLAAPSWLAQSVPSWAGLRARAADLRTSPHAAAWLVGASAAALTFTLLSAMVFGGSERADARVVRPITEVRPAEPALRRDDDSPLFAPQPVGAPEPRLPGVTDLDAPTPTPETAHTEAHTQADADAPAPALGGVTGPKTIINPNRPAPTDRALAPAPIAGLTSPGPGGLLPAISPDGLTPADAYARPFANPGDRPLVAVLVGGLGLSSEATEAAIRDLPPEVTLAFVPYVDNLQSWIDKARAAGHEVVLELPMEPFDYPNNDPGPYTLLADADTGENARRLDWLMARTTGYFAVMNYMGARFASSPRAVEPFAETLTQRGVAYISDGAGRRAAIGSAMAAAGGRAATASRIIDTEISSSAIDEALLELEALAIQNGAALGVGAAYPVTLQQLELWTETLELKGYALAPVSAVLGQLAQDGPAPRAQTQASLSPSAPAEVVHVQADFGHKTPAGATSEAGGKGKDDH